MQQAMTRKPHAKKLLRSRWAKLALVVLHLAWVVLPVKIASAHPLGNFTVNRYSRLEVASNQITLIYIVDRAEIPSFQEREAIDANKDGQLSHDEQQAYLQAEVARYRPNLKLLVDGVPVALQIESNQIDFPAGQGGLLTQRITSRFTTSISNLQSPISINYTDNNFAGRLGWQEIVLKAGQNVTLQGENLPTKDISNALRDYPQDMLQSPVQRSAVSFQLSALSGQQSTISNQPLTRRSTLDAPRSDDPFADLIQIEELTLGTVLLAMLGAFVWGAAHALSPGHGKTIVAAYVVGQRATIKHAVFLGATTTITHTAGVFALGLITLFASQFILPETLYPWLEVISGVLVVILGATLLRGRLASLLQVLKVGKVSNVNNLTNASHTDFDPTQPHDHGDGFVHKHVMPGVGTPGQTVGWRGLLALGVSGGLLPCPSALVVMLSAIALNRVGFGMLLIVIFSLGLASVLIAIGMLLVRAGKLMERATQAMSRSRFKFTTSLIKAAPVFSALFITVVGLGITWRALAMAGVIRI
jgi:ABC-type nickel/cobalt efflux system permease component RcnA